MKPHNVIKELNLLEISAVDRPAQVGARVTLLKRADPETETPPSTAEVNGNNETSQGNDMTDVTIESLTKALEDVKTELAKAEFLAKASDAVKAHLKTLDDAAKEKFLALAPEEQEKRAAAVKKSDETLELHGQTIAKSAVGDGVFAVMKAQASEIKKAQEEIAKARDEAELERLAKSADDDLKNLPGDRVTKARILKASNALSTEDKTAFDAMLKAANSSLAKAFTTIGKGTGEVVEGSAQDKLDKAAKDIVKRDSVSIEKAYATAAQENPELYETADAERVAS